MKVSRPAVLYFLVELGKIGCEIFSYLDRIKIMSKLRLQHIDGLRALAAIFVMFNHGFRLPWPNVPVVAFEQHPEGILFILTSWMRYGHFAVTVFIAISGYCLMLPFVQSTKLDTKTIGRFYGRRVWRILPTYYAALIISLVLIYLAIGFKTGTQWDACLPVTFNGILVRVFMLQDVFIRHQINNPLWAIATMWRVYLVFPVILVLFRRLGPMLSTCIIVIGSLAVQYFRPFPYATHITIAYLAIFSLGCLGAYVQDELKDSIIGLLRMAWVGITVILIVFFAMVSYSESRPFWRIADYGVGFSVVALFIDLHRRPCSKIGVFLSNPYLAYIGKISYSIYLMHFPFQALVWIYLINPLGVSLYAKFIIFVFFGFPIVILFPIEFSRFQAA